MIRRTTKIALEVLGIILAGVAVLAGLAAWRLSTGPISIDFLAPYLEEDLASPDNSYFLKLGDLEVIWGGWSRALTLQADNVKLFRQDGTLITSIPLIEIGLSASALLYGDLAPTSLFLIDPKLRLRRSADGQISFGLGGAERENEPINEGASEAVKNFILGLAAKPNRDQPSGYLTDLRIINGDVNVVDERFAMVWDVPDATIDLQRDKIGLRLDADFNLNFLGEITTVHASGIYNRELATLVLGVGFANLVPPSFADRIDALDYLTAFDFAFDGDLSFAVDITGEVVDIEVNLSSGPGRFISPDLYPDGLGVEAVQLSGRLGENLDSVAIDNLLVDLGGPALVIAGEVNGLRSAPIIDADIALSDLPVDDFGRIWPLGVGEGARDWITENLSDGVVHEVRATGKLTALDPDLDNFRVDGLDGTMKYSGVTVEYLRPMPPVRNVEGTTRFNDQRFDIFIDSGGIDDLVVAGGRVGITRFDNPPEHAAIDLTVAGPVAQALALIDNPPLRYASKMDIDPATIGGDSNIHLRLAFPLLNAISVDELNPKAAAKISALKWADVVDTVDVEDGNLSLDVDEKRMIADGTVTAAGKPIDVNWTENFTDTETVSEVRISGFVDDATLQEVASELSPFLAGSAKVDLHYTSYHGGGATLAAVCDFSDSSMAFPVLAWTKGEGEPGHAEFTLKLEDSKPVEIERFEFTSGGMIARGGATFTPSSDGVQSVTIDELSTGETQIAGTINFESGNLSGFKVTGKSLDLTHIMDEWFNKTDETDADVKEETKGNLDIQAEVGRLYFNFEEQRFVDDFRLSVQRRGTFIQSANVEMKLPKRGEIFGMSIEPTGNIRFLSASTEDAGDLFRVLGIVDTLEGGKLSLSGQFNDSKDEQVLSAKLKIIDFYAVDAPILAQILTVASFTGIVDVLNGRGIYFDVLEGDIDAVGDLYTISNGRAHGSALGLTMNGTYDDEKDRIAFQGTIVPAYFFNSLLGNIPLIGNILVGEKGSGIFAVSYSVSGPQETPEVSVNPLSALLPGVMRDILTGAGPSDSDEKPLYPYDGANEPRNK
ncbi:MAG: DUF3971 domain-containing protein [Alphaproteobacteria bacterium]|nr:DUF3971 domain-containing protein [Alphaproteobacteria bacterium]